MNWPWRSSEPERVWERILWSPLSLFAGMFRVAGSANRGRYTRGWKAQRRVDARVISVGSLLVGGSGKTPLASWLAETLHRRGHKVALLSRGYGGKPGQVVTVVSDGRALYAGPKDAGDEPVMLAGQAVGVPVIVSKDRGLAALRAISTTGAELLVLDDGFQHHRLHRDLDLLTFDGQFGVGNGRMLPRGPLREPMSALERADAIIEIDGALDSEVDELIERQAAGVPRFRGQRVPVSLATLRGDVRVSPTTLNGMKVGMISGIARPDSFRRTLEALGAQVVATRIFPDHHRYRPHDFRELEEDVSVWITSEKDAGKIMPHWVGTADVRVLGVRLVVDEGDALIGWLEGELGLAQRR